jgi:alcohol dehydrogenase
VRFANHLPVRIRFGDGVIAELAATLAAEGVRRPFIVLDAHVAMLGPVQAAIAALAVDGVDTYVAHPGEPTIERVEALAAELAATGADGLVAIGGGSVLDLAKGARLVASHGGPLTRFTWPGSPEPIGPIAMPLVLAPTTAGTGSEVTGGVVVIDPARRLKVAAPSPHNRASWALVDPELTHGLPREPTIHGGVDALAQCLAPTVTVTRTPVGDGIGLEGTRIAARALPAVAADPNDAAARSAMACASLLGGLAMNVSEAGTEHSLAHPLGALLHLPHGLTVGLMLAESMEHDRRYVPERMERIADALGEPDDGSRDGTRAVRSVQRVLAAIGLPTLRDVGVTEEHLDDLVDATLAAWIPVEPGPWTRADVRAAYGRALALERRV